MLQIPLYVSLLVSAASFWMACRPAAAPESARWILVFGAVWALAQWRRWRWFASFGFIAALILAGWCVWQELSVGWTLCGILAALLAWDLAEFDRRLRFSDPEDAPALRRRHLLRLGFLVAAGLSFSLIRMLVRAEVTLEWTAYLALLASLGLSLLLGKQTA